MQTPSPGSGFPTNKTSANFSEVTPSGRRSRIIEALLQLFIGLSIFSTPFAKVIAGIISSLCIILFILYCFFRQNQKWVKDAVIYYRIVVAYCAIFVLGVLYTPDPANGVFEAWRQVTRLTMPVMIVEMVSTMSIARRYLYAFVAGSTILALIGIYEGFFLHIERPPSMWHPVHGANILMFGLIGATVAVATDKQGTRRILMVGSSCIIALAIYLAGTRGVWIATAVVLALLPLAYPGFSAKQKLVAMGIIMCLLILVSRAPFVRERAQLALSNINAYLNEDRSTHTTPLGERFDMWKASVQMFKEHPVRGVGTGGWKRSAEEIVGAGLIPKSITQYGNPHNVFIEAMSSRGIIGLLAVLALIGYPLYLAVDTRSTPATRPYALLLLCASVAFIISGMTDTLVIIRGVFSSYLILIGIGLAMIFRYSGRIQGSGSAGQ